MNHSFGDTQKTADVLSLCTIIYFVNFVIGRVH